MRKIAGWLCYTSLILTIAFTAYYAYLTLAPFFMGGMLVDYNYTGYEISQRLAANGLNKSDNNLLQKYVAASLPIDIRRDLDAMYSAIGDWNITTLEKPEQIAIWAAVADKGGKVVASYPEDLADSEVTILSHDGAGWRGAFGNRLKDDEFLDVETIRDSQGNVIGSLATGLRFDPRKNVAIIPPKARIYGVMSPFSTFIAAAICILAFAVLLPTWVALDASWRGMRSFAWVALIILTGPIGLAAYMIARLPTPKLCPNCGEEVFSKFKKCPACGTLLRISCPICGRKLKPGWQYCPTCTGEQFKKQTEPKQEEAQPEEPITIHPAPNSDSAHFEIPGKPDLCEPVCEEYVNGSIAGRVVDKGTMQPVSGAMIYIDSARVDRDTITDTNGEFCISDIPPGPYSFCAEVVGYARQIKIAEIEPGKCLTMGFALELVVEIGEQEAANGTE